VTVKVSSLLYDELDDDCDDSLVDDEDDEDDDELSLWVSV
jgi:hypothetical protein